MKRFNYEISREYKNSQNCNPSILLSGKWNRQNVEFFIDAGTSDDISAWYDKEQIYVLSQNRSRVYIGLQVFGTHQAYEGLIELDNVFFQGDEVHSILGENWYELQDYTLRKRMMQYC